MGSAPEGKAGPGLLSVLLGAVGVGPLLLYGLSATSDRVILDLGINEAQFGLLATVCFASAAIGNATLARMADRHSDVFLMTVVFLLAASALLLAAVPAGYGLLLIAVGISGVAQSFPNGVTNRILLERVTWKRRIGWVGIKQSGVQVSQLTASLTFPLLALAVGWRGAAAAITLLPLVLLVLSWRSLRTVPLLPEAQASSTAATAASDSAAAPNRRRYPGMVWGLTAFGMLNGIGVQATNVYMPLFAVRELDFSLVLGGVTAAVAGVVGVAARIGWARVMARGASGPLVLIVLASLALLGALAFYGAWATGGAALLWLAVCLHGTAALGVSVVVMSALVRSIPSNLMASASGITTAGMFAGFALGPAVMGAAVSSPGGFPLGWGAVALVYMACTVLAAALLAVQRRR
ncbi:MFS transporter [Nesterenkonia natronophila]|uniref:MFS transporter n=1 Tax=Nesterenkonia natronophila TaxID=2174932 RepID=A0A3A4EYY6_9MICC|nr:MFS transporter [Nesterenkonia natronophila]RJN31063.1 MFS transporter [Nesterenkonia natronophila]